MDTFIRNLFYLSLSTALIALALWIAKTSLFRDGTPRAIAPFEIVGKNDSEGKLGRVLAHLTLARLATIHEQIRSLDLTPQPTTPLRTVQGLRPIHLLYIKPVRRTPYKLFKPFEIQMSLGGVQVTGLFSRLHRWMLGDQIVSVSIHYQDSMATIAASLGSEADSVVLMTTDPASPDDIVDGIAYAIVRQAALRDAPGMQPLTATDFKSLLDVLVQLKEFNRRIYEEGVTTAELTVLSSQLDTLARKSPEWRALTLLAAQTGRDAGQTENAISNYQRALQQTATTDREHSALGLEIEALKKRLKMEQTEYAARMTAAGADHPDTRTAHIRKLMGADAKTDAPGMAIAVLGGLPPVDLLPSERQIVVGTGETVRSDLGSEYVSLLVRTVEIVAPTAVFVFTPMETSESGTTTDADILGALDRLAEAEPRPRILLIAFGPLGNRPVFSLILRALHDRGIVSVVSSGNETEAQVPFEGMGLVDHVMFVSAVDDNGDRSHFTLAGPGVFWAPGQDIPVARGDGQITLKSGTGPAAALAAGLVARVMAEHPQIEVDTLLAVLRRTSRPVNISEGPAVLNLATALEELSP